MRLLKSVIANLVTSCRIILSLILLLLSQNSIWFYVCYLFAGFTDMIDGTIARKLKTESEFGEKLDTIADIAFLAVAAYKLLPTFDISIAMWVWIGIIAVIKVINIISGFVVQKKVVAVHSWANKITGILLFVLPFSIYVINVNYYLIVVCLLATFAAIQEYYFIRKNLN